MALPVSWEVHFFAKCVVLVFLVAFSSCLATALVPVTGWLLDILAPQLGLTGPPPWTYLTARSCVIVVAALLMCMLQLVIALRWQSFTVSMGIGMCAAAVAIFLPPDSAIALWFPWSMARQVLANGHALAIVAVSVVGSFVVAAWGAWDFARRAWI